MKENRVLRSYKKQATLIFLVSLVILITVVVIGAFWYRDAIQNGLIALSDAFREEKTQMQQSTYQQFYDSAYQKAEEEHHVTNRVNISIEGIKSNPQLEVLRISDIEYETGSNRSAVVWLAIPGESSYTVNLNMAEFLIDDARHTVVVRVPEPTLGDVSIDLSNLRQLLVEENGWHIFNRASESLTLTNSEIEKAQDDMKESFENNQSLFLMAEESGKTIITNLIEAINPDVDDLTVVVEYVTEKDQRIDEAYIAANLKIKETVPNKQVVCPQCSAPILVTSYRTIVVCPYCNSEFPFEGYVYQDISDAASMYASIEYETDCPACRSTHMFLWGDLETGRWKCADCGYTLGAKEMNEGVLWFCDYCEAYLNIQNGFNVNNESWKCTECGKITNVTEDNVF